MLAGPSERYVPVVESAMDEDLDPHPCEEDEEFFKSRPNNKEMEQAISKFLDGMPAVESKRYEQLHRHRALLPVPDSKKIKSEGNSVNTSCQSLDVCTSTNQYKPVCTSTY